jgi:hypothetical protein
MIDSGKEINSYAAYLNIAVSEDMKMSQALDWFKQFSTSMVLGYIEYLKQEAARRQAAGRPISDSPLINRGALLREWDRGRRFF